MKHKIAIIGLPLLGIGIILALLWRFGPTAAEDLGLSTGRSGFEAQSVARTVGLATHFAGSASCAECHSEEHTPQFETQHSGGACETCHGPALAHVEDDSVPLDPIPEEACAACHQELPARRASFPQVSLVQHYAQSECTSCHDPADTTRHIPASLANANNAACVECHGSEQENAKLVKLSNGHAEVYCVQCHQPQVVDQPVAACTECHAPSTAVGIHAWEGHQETACAECHQPHKPALAAETTCTDCHDKAPVEALAIAHTLTDKQDCAQCHAPGKPAPLEASHTATATENCALCHQQSTEAPTRILHGAEGREACTTCHKQGGIAPAATHERTSDGNCQLCHEESTPAPALPHALIGQADCTSCHAPGESAGALREDHPWRDDPVCVACHDPSPTLE